MLFLVILCGFAFLGLALCVLSIFMVTIIGNELQAKADTIVVEAATTINANDVVGQMNNLISRSRMLVESSRSSYESSATGPKRHLQGLAQYLLNESRSGAEFLEKQRAELSTIKSAGVSDLIKDRLTGSGFRSVCPWVKIRQVSVKNLSVGTMIDLYSNVLAGKNELYDYDLRHHYIEASSHLYGGNLNAKLPNADRDLNFNLSGLPAPVGSIVAPARLIAGEHFVPLAKICSDDQTKIDRSSQIPAAVQVEFSCTVIDQFTGHEHIVQRSATACTSGAQPIR
ncbi:MAG: hypothetical protein C5B53_02210 [Candidatus Melainabacteria bacterium]|nr:MAG: hypothetical protein C5B53_02210 [Candidatus Melainabacteria bacterium]